MNNAAAIRVTSDTDPTIDHDLGQQWYKDLTGRTDIDMLYVHGTDWPNPVGWDHSRRLPKRQASLTGGPYSATHHSTMGAGCYLEAARTGAEISAAYPGGFTLAVVAKLTTGTCGLLGNEAGSGNSGISLLFNTNTITALCREGATSYSCSMGFTSAGGDSVLKYQLILASFDPGQPVKLRRYAEAPASTALQTEDGTPAGGSLPGTIAGGTGAFRAGRSREATYVADHDQIMSFVVGAPLGDDTAGMLALYEHIKGVLADYSLVV